MTSPSAAPTLIAPSDAAVAADGRARTYEVRTFGCQMNVHDSERLSGSLESAGYVRAEAGSEADVVVINTCAVRDNAAGKLYGTLGHLKSRKDRHEGMQIAVGGCMRSEEHTSELQSHHDLVCRLLLEKKKTMALVKLIATETSNLTSTQWSFGAGTRPEAAQPMRQPTQSGPSAAGPINRTAISIAAIGRPIPTVSAADMPATRATVTGICGTSTSVAAPAAAPMNSKGKAAPPRQPEARHRASASALRKANTSKAPMPASFAQPSIASSS